MRVFSLVFLLGFLGGCQVVPDHLVVRDPAGNILAKADTQSGEIQLTWMGLHAIQPKLVLPRTK